MAPHDHPPVNPAYPQKPAKWALTLTLIALANVGIYVLTAAATNNFSIIFFGFPFFIGYSIGAIALKRPYLSTFICFWIVSTILVMSYLEGVACFIMVAPLILPMALCGTFCGNISRRWLKTRKQQLTSIAVLLAAYSAVHGLDQSYRKDLLHPWHTVTGEIIINSSPPAVFGAITGLDPTSDLGHTTNPPRPVTLRGPWPFILQVGLPVPLSLEIKEPRLGASNCSIKSRLILTNICYLHIFTT